MGKYVLYKENGDYRFTNEANYKARISNANQIATFKKDNGFESPRDVVDYICKYSKGVVPEDIRILTESSASNEHERRFYGLVDQIDILSNMIFDKGDISPDQRDQLIDLMNQVESFGERGAKWANLCKKLLSQYTPVLESMMGFYTKFVGRFDCPPILAEAAMNAFKAVLMESSVSSGVAEQLRQKVGVNPNETQGIGVFGLSGDDNLPQQTTIDNEIADSMAAGTFDALGDDISTTDPNNVDETVMGLGSSETDTSGNDLNPDDWAESVAKPADGLEDENNDNSVADDDVTDTDSEPTTTFESVEASTQLDSVAKIEHYMENGGEPATDTVQMLLLGGNYEDCRLSMYTAREYLFDRKHLLGSEVADGDVPALPLARSAIYDLVDSLDGSDKAALLSDIIEYAASHGSMAELDAIEKYID